MVAGPRMIIPVRSRPLLRVIGRLADRCDVRAYAVGGCVRDWLAGGSAGMDLDIVVEGHGIAFARELVRALGGSLDTHEQFGTAVAVVRHRLYGAHAMRIDVATARRESYAEPAAYPRIVAGTLEDDLFRRDFTINAMAVAIGSRRFGALMDPFGGASDLERKLLRILHARSFLDDPSRILRGIRFRHRFGLRWDRSTAAALEEAVSSGALGRLNAGRVRKEFDRMGCEPDPGACFQELAGWIEGAT